MVGPALHHHDMQVLDGHGRILRIRQHQRREIRSLDGHADLRRKIAPFIHHADADSMPEMPSERIPTIADERRSSAVDGHVALHLRRDFVNGERLDFQRLLACLLIIDGIRHLVFENCVTLRGAALLFPQIRLRHRATCRQQAAECQQSSCLSHLLSFVFGWICTIDNMCD